MNTDYKHHVLKFLQKYLFILKSASDGWRIKYNNKDKIIFYKNINEIDSNKSSNVNLLNTDNFISYYRMQI
jgi:hypothetical protein